MSVRSLFFSIIILLSLQSVCSQNIIELTVDDGLSQGFVSSIVQDNDGYIWAGTINGLNRYDGYQFKTYRHAKNDANSVSSDEIQSLAHDHTGRIWVATNAGIQYYDPGKDCFETPRILTENKVGHSSGFSISGDRLLVADREILRIFRIKGSDPRNILELETSIPVLQEYQTLGSLNCLFQRDGKIWAGTYDGIFEISNNGQFTRVLPGIRASVYQIWNDEIHNQICIQTIDEVIFMNRNGELNRIPVSEMNYGAGLAGRKMGDKYVLFIGEEVRLWNGSDLNSTDINFGKKIVSGFVDRQDNLWLGFDGTGISCVKKRDNSVTRIFRKDISASKKPLLAEDGSIWLYCRPKGKEQPVYAGYTREGEPLNRHRIGYHFENGYNGKDWLVKSDFQLASVDRSGTERLAQNPDPGKLHVTFGVTALPDSKLMLLSASGRAIRFYDPASGLIFAVPEADQILKQSEKSINQINTDIINTDQGYYVWISGEFGIIRLWPDWGKRTCAVANPGAEVLSGNSDDKARIIFAQPDRFVPNLLWIGAWNGLFRMDIRNNSIIRVVSYHLPETDPVFCMAQTEPDNLWLGTQHGLVNYDVKSGKSRIYTVKDGLPAGEFNRNTAIASRDGLIVMGTVEGYIAFYPDELGRKEPLSKVLITQVFRGKFSMPLEWSNKVVTIPDMAYDSANIMICFSSLDFRNHDVQQYRFRINSDAEWLYNGYKNSVSLAGLPPGEYHFEVQSSLGGSEWSDSTFLQFVITPPWWKSWWARSLIALLILIPALLIIRNRQLLQKEKQRSELLMQQNKYEKMLDENREKLLTNIAHDLKTPITLINGLIDSWDESTPENTKKMTATISRQGQEMNKLVNQIINLNRLKKMGTLPMNPLPTDLNQVIHHLISSYKYLAELKQVDFQLNMNQSPGLVLLDESHLRTILGNLLSNAVKFTPSGGQIVFEVESDGDQLVFRVTDSGPGIPKAERDKIFERYYQSQQARELGGSGIGLSYAAEVAGLIGGKLELVNRDDRKTGATFQCRLPLHRVDTDAEPVDKNMNENDSSTIRTDEKPLILIVEDHPEMGEFIRQLLTADYQVVLARDGRAGFERALQLVPDLIISDIMMPEMNGTELCRQLRNDIRTSHIPVILLTAKSDSESVSTGLKNGANLFLTKPFDKDQLRYYVSNSLMLAFQTRDYYRKQWSGDSVVTDTPAGITSEQEADFIRNINRIITENYTDYTFNVEKLAMLLHVSKTQLHRKIGALGGESAGNMIRLVRLQKARTMLMTDSVLTIAEIAFECGFADANYFSTAFSREYGVSPSSFRKHQP